MIVRAALIALLAVLVVACSEKPAEEPAKPKQAPANAQQNPMERGPVGAYYRSKETGAAANIESIKTAIRSFYVANERYPANIDEIKAYIGSDIDLGPYVYDPKTGSLAPKPQ